MGNTIFRLGFSRGTVEEIDFKDPATRLAGPAVRCGAGGAAKA
jgi:hypothetical protein